LTIFVGPVGGGKLDFIHILFNFFHHPKHKMFEYGTVRLEFSDEFICQISKNELKINGKKSKFTGEFESVRNSFYFSQSQYPSTEPVNMSFDTIPEFYFAKQFLSLTEDERKLLNLNLFELTNTEVMLTPFTVSKNPSGKTKKEKLIKNNLNLIKYFQGNPFSLQLNCDGQCLSIHEVETTILDTLKIFLSYFSKCQTLVLNDPTKSFSCSYAKEVFLTMNLLPFKKKIIMVSNFLDVFRLDEVPIQIFHLRNLMFNQNIFTHICDVNLIKTRKYYLALYANRIIFVEGKNDIKILEALQKYIIDQKWNGFSEFLESTIIGMDGKNKSMNASKFAIAIQTPHKFIFDADALFKLKKNISGKFFINVQNITLIDGLFDMFGLTKGKLIEGTLGEIKNNFPEQIVQTVEYLKTQGFLFLTQTDAKSENLFSDMETFLASQRKKKKSVSNFGLKFCGHLKNYFWKFSAEMLEEIVKKIPRESCLLTFLSNDPENKWIV
jgi:hypothetical protein